MERSFVIKEVDGDLFSTAWKVKAITEKELKLRLLTIFEGNYDLDKSIETLLHGEPKKDEWVDFGESLDDGLHHWSAGNGIGYLVETFRKMPRGK